MLQKMQTDITAPVAQITGQATGILQQAQGIGYGAQNVAQQYASLYPSTMPGASLATTQASLATWRQNNTLALQQAMQVQNQIAQGQAGVAAQVGGAVSASQAAPGQTAAIQATNQLLATVTGQLTQLQALLITQARAEQTLAAQAQVSQAAGAADSQRFWSGGAAPSRVQNPGSRPALSHCRLHQRPGGRQRGHLAQVLDHAPARCAPPASEHAVDAAWARPPTPRPSTTSSTSSGPRSMPGSG